MTGRTGKRVIAISKKLNGGFGIGMRFLGYRWHSDPDPSHPVELIRGVYDALLGRLVEIIDQRLCHTGRFFHGDSLRYKILPTISIFRANIHVPKWTSIPADSHSGAVQFRPSALNAPDLST